VTPPLVFGDPARFALEVDVDPPDAWGAAHLQYSIGGAPLGTWEEVSVLATLLDVLQGWLPHVPPAPADLAGRPAEEAFAAVHAVLTDPDAGRPDFPLERCRLYERLALSPNGVASFDGHHAYLLREPARDRVLHRAFGETAVRDTALASGEVERVLRAALAHPWRR